MPGGVMVADVVADLQKQCDSELSYSCCTIGRDITDRNTFGFCSVNIYYLSLIHI